MHPLICGTESDFVLSPTPMRYLYCSAVLRIDEMLEK